MLFLLQEDSGSMPGVLANTLILASAVAFVLSSAVLSLYRRTVRRLMRMQPAGAIPARPPVLDSNQIDPSIYLAPFPERAPEPQPLVTARLRQWRLAAVYVAAGLCCSFALAMALLVDAGTYSWLGAAFLLVVNSWPIVLCLHYIVGWNWRIRRRNELLYLGALLLVGWVSQLVHHKLTMAQIGLAFALTNVPATLLVYAFSSRPLRGIGPTIFPLCVWGVAGAWTLAHFAATDSRVAVWISNLTDAIGLSVNGAVIATYLFGFAAMIPGGWLAVLWITRRYRMRRMSDQSLLLDSVWLLFIAVQAIVLGTPVSGGSSRGLFWIAASFPLYLLVKAAGYRLLRKRELGAPAVSLLVLRSFSLEKRAERVFRVVTLFWRYLGDVRLIGGPDVAASTIQPHALLEFASRKLRASFIDSPEALDSRMRGLDAPPDPDGRFRIYDFFCFDNTWQLAVQRLIRSSSVVLADLRGFPGTSRGGCEFEIREVLNALPAERFVILLNRQTDRGRLASILDDAWNTLAADSPNRHRRERAIRTVDYDGPEHRSIPQLLKAIFAASDVAEMSERGVAAR